MYTAVWVTPCVRLVVPGGEEERKGGRDIRKDEEEREVMRGEEEEEDRDLQQTCRDVQRGKKWRKEGKNENQERRGNVMRKTFCMNK